MLNVQDFWTCPGFQSILLPGFFSLLVLPEQSVSRIFPERERFSAVPHEVLPAYVIGMWEIYRFSLQPGDWGVQSPHKPDVISLICMRDDMLHLREDQLQHRKPDSGCGTRNAKDRTLINDACCGS